MARNAAVLIFAVAITSFLLAYENKFASAGTTYVYLINVEEEEGTKLVNPDTVVVNSVDGNNIVQKDEDAKGTIGKDGKKKGDVAVAFGDVTVEKDGGIPAGGQDKTEDNTDNKTKDNGRH